jgi:hypothetical protein
MNQRQLIHDDDHVQGTHSSASNPTLPAVPHAHTSRFPVALPSPHQQRSLRALVASLLSLQQHLTSTSRQCSAWSTSGPGTSAEQSTDSPRPQDDPAASDSSQALIQPTSLPSPQQPPLALLPQPAFACAAVDLLQGGDFCMRDYTHAHPASRTSPDPTPPQQPSVSSHLSGEEGWRDLEGNGSGGGGGGGGVCDTLNLALPPLPPHSCEEACDALVAGVQVGLACSLFMIRSIQGWPAPFLRYDRY